MIVILILLTICVVACMASGPSCCEPRRRSGASTLFTGLLIVLVGTVLLLDRLGIVYAGDIFRFWPALLIIFGLVGIFRAKEPGQLVARGLIGLAGVLLLLMELQLIHVTFHEIWPVFIIAAGLLMIWGALRPSRATIGVKPRPETNSTSDPHLNVTSIFSDGNWNITAQDFENGYVRAVFGGFKVDLTQAEMSGSRAYVTLDVVFGGGEIRIPSAWNVLIDVRPVFGSCEDKTRRLQQPAAAKTLVLRGKVVFGGIEIRN